MKKFWLLLSLCACSSSLEPTSTNTSAVPQCAGQVETPDVPPKPNQVPPARIQFRVVDDEDGVHYAVGIFDRLRRESCEYRTAADGVTRCLPITDAKMFQSFYADPNCTIRVAVTGRAVKGATDKPPVTAELVGDAANTHIYGISREYGFDSFALNTVGEWTLYRQLVDFYVWDPAWKPSPLTLLCPPISPSLFERYWIVGAEIPATEFAAMPQRTVDGTP